MANPAFWLPEHGSTRRARPCAPAYARHALSQLVADHAMLPALCRLGNNTNFVSDLRFDPKGELLASCSTAGVVAVHQLEQFCGSMGHAIAASPESLPPEPSSSCHPLFKATPDGDNSPHAIRWNPGNPNQLMCGLGQSGELLLYDLAAARPGRPARRLRSSVQAGGVADIDLLRDGQLVVAGGRDGALRVWDLRAPGPVVRQSSQSSAWTMGVKNKDLRAGAIHSITGSLDGKRVHASTAEGCVLTWDVRSLNTPQSMMRVARALTGSTRPFAIDALLPHPTLRNTFAFQVRARRCPGRLLGVFVALFAPPACSDVVDRCVPRHFAQTLSRVGLIDLEANREGGQYNQGALLASCRIDDEATSTMALLAAQGGPSAATADAGGVMGLEPGGPMLSEGAAAAAARTGTDWRVRSRRPTWMLEDGWLCCSRPGAPLACLVEVEPLCSEMKVAHALPLPAPLVAAAQHPRGHFLAVGLADNTVGLCMPLPTRRARIERDEEERARAAAAEAEEAARLAEIDARLQAERQEAARRAAEQAAERAAQQAARDAEARAAREEAEWVAAAQEAEARLAREQQAAERASRAAAAAAARPPARPRPPIPILAAWSAGAQAEQAGPPAPKKQKQASLAAFFAPKAAGAGPSV